jgi:hypothetical protein
MSAASLRGRLRPLEIVIIKLLPDQQLALLAPMLHDDAGLASDGLVFCFHTQWVQPVAAIAVNQLDVLLGEEVAEVACTRFRGHRVRCFDGTGGESWRGGSLHASSSLRLYG